MVRPLRIEIPGVPDLYLGRYTNQNGAWHLLGPEETNVLFLSYRDLRRGVVLGSKGFRKELLEQTGHWLGPNHFGAERRETA